MTFRTRSLAAGLLTVCVVSLFAVGCRQKYGPHIAVDWRSSQPGVTTATPVRYLGTGSGGAETWVDVGEVTKVLPATSGTAVQIGLYRKSSHYVTTKTTFRVRPGAGGSVFIQAIPLAADASPVQDGAVLAGSDSDIEVQARKLVTDWRRSGTVVLAALIAVVILLLVASLFLRFAAVIACVAGGVASAWYFKDTLGKLIAPHLPQGLNPDIATYAVGFLAGYLASLLILALLRAPLRVGRRTP